MADVMIAVTPFHGHAAPMAAVAAAFVEAGHSVRVDTGEAYAARFEAVGAEVLRWRTAPDFDEHDLAATFPALAGRKGPRQLLLNVEHLFVRTGSGQFDDLRAAFAARPWDVIVAESTSLGAALVAESTGTPWATVALTPLTLPSIALPPPGLALRPARGGPGRARDRLLHRVARLVTRPIQRAYAEQRLAAGLPPTATTFDEACYSPQLVCANGVAELENPRPEASGRLRSVGRLARPGDDDLERPDWWHEVPPASHGRAPASTCTRGGRRRERSPARFAGSHGTPRTG
ncbi:hypothetical protein [Agromyces sp. S2-1-8]|uniref:hypothetical protein n=1 Tax=Agromyces sp. S2-1-8 TaxID=2897180 RepID=UPI001E61505E|nr:hypothetical protein [Agromyces sp. S2-1-8]MCD5347031.1 hypothetical protein [Agromyces sp. S2-1-8]